MWPISVSINVYVTIRTVRIMDLLCHNIREKVIVSPYNWYTQNNIKRTINNLNRIEKNDRRGIYLTPALALWRPFLQPAKMLFVIRHCIFLLDDEE